LLSVIRSRSRCSAGSESPNATVNAWLTDEAAMSTFCVCAAPMALPPRSLTSLTLTTKD